MAKTSDVLEEIQRTVYLLNPGTARYETYLVSGFPTKVAAFPEYMWLLAINPVQGAVASRKYMVIEPGTSYILAYGSSETLCKTAAKERFGVAGENIRRADVRQYLAAQVKLVYKFLNKEVFPEKKHD